MGSKRRKHRDRLLQASQRPDKTGYIAHEDDNCDFFAGLRHFPVGVVFAVIFLIGFTIIVFLPKLRGSDRDLKMLGPIGVDCASPHGEAVENTKPNEGQDKNRNQNRRWSCFGVECRHDSNNTEENGLGGCNERPDEVSPRTLDISESPTLFSATVQRGKTGLIFQFSFFPLRSHSAVPVLIRNQDSPLGALDAAPPM